MGNAGKHPDYPPSYGPSYHGRDPGCDPCCGCWGIVDGATTAAIWTFVYAFSQLALFGWQTSVISVFGNRFPGRESLDYQRQQETFHNALFSIQVVHLITDCFLFMSSLAFIWGIHSRSRYLMWPWFPSLGLNILITFAWCLTWWIRGVQDYWIMLTGAEIIAVVANSYCLIVGFKVYAFIKSNPSPPGWVSKALQDRPPRYRTGNNINSTSNLTPAKPTASGHEKVSEYLRNVHGIQDNIPNGFTLGDHKNANENDDLHLTYKGEKLTSDQIQSIRQFLRLREIQNSQHNVAQLGLPLNASQAALGTMEGGGFVNAAFDATSPMTGAGVLLPGYQPGTQGFRGPLDSGLGLGQHQPINVGLNPNLPVTSNIPGPYPQSQPPFQPQPNVIQLGDLSRQSHRRSSRRRRSGRHQNGTEGTRSYSSGDLLSSASCCQHRDDVDTATTSFSRTSEHSASCRSRCSSRHSSRRRHRRRSSDRGEDDITASAASLADTSCRSHPSRRSDGSRRRRHRKHSHDGGGGSRDDVTASVASLADTSCRSHHSRRSDSSRRSRRREHRQNYDDTTNNTPEMSSRHGSGRRRHQFHSNDQDLNAVTSKSSGHHIQNSHHNPSRDNIRRVPSTSSTDPDTNIHPRKPPDDNMSRGSSRRSSSGDRKRHHHGRQNSGGSNRNLNQQPQGTPPAGGATSIDSKNAFPPTTSIGDSPSIQNRGESRRPKLPPPTAPKPKLQAVTTTANSKPPMTSGASVGIGSSTAGAINQAGSMIQPIVIGPEAFNLSRDPSGGPGGGNYTANVVIRYDKETGQSVMEHTQPTNVVMRDGRVSMIHRDSAGHTIV